MVRVVILPGNGNCDVNECCWYPWLARKLRSHPRVSEVLLRNMPEPYKATRSVWLAFMRDELRCHRDTLVVGHSSGAVAAMRYSETTPLAACFLVGAYVSALGCPLERAAGYFDGPWLWSEMLRNVPAWYQYASESDPFLPIGEQAEVASKLSATVRWDEQGGHYNECESLPALLKDIAAFLDTTKL